MDIHNVNPSDSSFSWKNYWNEHPDKSASEIKAIKEALHERGISGDVQEADIESAVVHLDHHLTELTAETRSQYIQIQQAYLNGDETSAACAEKLDALMDAHKHQVDTSVHETISKLTPETTGIDDPLVTHVREAVFAHSPNGAFVSEGYQHSVHKADAPWPGGKIEQMMVQAMLIGGVVPFTINVPPGTDLSKVYLRVQGIDPQTKKPCYVTWDKSGNPQYHDYDPKHPPDPSKYCVRFSDLPHDGDQIKIKLPELISGRMYFSEGPLHTDNPDPQNPSSPDYETKWSMIEFTNNGTIFADVSAVDTFGPPSIQMRMKTKNGEGPKIGFGGDPNKLLNDFQNNLNKYDTSPNHTWSGGGLFLHGKDGKVLRAMSPKHMPGQFKHYYDNYLKKVFLAYYQEGKGGHSLYLEASINGKRVVLRGQVSADGKNFNFYDKSGKLVTSLPTNGDNSIPWFTGATGDWCPGKETSDTQKDLMRDLAAMLNAGVRPQDATTDWDHPIGKQFFLDHRDLFYKATDSDGSPMYNVYDRAMHEAGYNGYAFDYDDILGQDGTQIAPESDDPSFTVNLNL